MPYIEDENKRKYITGLAYQILDKANDAGDVVFLFFKVLLIWTTMKAKKHKFITYCMAMGICVCTMLEFYRRVIAKYEDKKIEENGDVL